jgi:putative endonuclease
MSDRHLLVGRSGEHRAALAYERQGYRVLDRNWRCGAGELDLVLEGDGVVVFCEVKARSSLAFGSPAEAVGPRTQRRIRHAAAAWLATSGVRAPTVRFDVAAVLPGSVEILQAAF